MYMLIYKSVKMLIRKLKKRIGTEKNVVFTMYCMFFDINNCISAVGETDLRKKGVKAFDRVDCRFFCVTGAF